LPRDFSISKKAVSETKEQFPWRSGSSKEEKREKRGRKPRSCREEARQAAKRLNKIEQKTKSRGEEEFSIKDKRGLFPKELKKKDVMGEERHSN